jgi:lycopene cyclase domain-containing protein
MTYFGFLIRFVIIPIGIMLALHLIARRSGRRLPDTLRGMPAVPTLIGHMLLALIYTTPWDNYLVATGVWFYDPELVAGIVIGWVPIEEYTFFLLQPLLSGLFLLFLALYMPLGPSGDYARPGLRRWSVVVVLAVWLVMLALLVVDYAPATYLSLQLVWGLPPIMLQLAFGADILWRYRRLVFWSLAPMTLYLALADSLAIDAGTWTIDPAQSLNVYLGGVLPVEEFTFFLLTNTLLVFGMTLVLARESQERLHGELIPRLNRAMRQRTAVE